jgi:hypothetical protein
MHGLFRASGMVMLHDHHASARTACWGSDQNAWVSFGKQRWANSRERRSPKDIKELNRWLRLGDRALNLTIEDDKRRGEFARAFLADQQETERTQ